VGGRIMEIGKEEVGEREGGGGRARGGWAGGCMEAGVDLRLESSFID